MAVPTVKISIWKEIRLLWRITPQKISLGIAFVHVSSVVNDIIIQRRVGDESITELGGSSAEIE